MTTMYQADLWCDSCGAAIERDLLKEGHKPPSYDPPWDTGDWPMHNLPSGESDSPQHCGASTECLEYELLPSGRKIGALLGTDLTHDGIAYVIDAVEEGGEVAEFWKEQFAQVDFPSDND